MMRILLVEDSPSDREILRHLLDAQFRGDVEFHEAATLESAFSILEARLVDCVVLDLQLPDSAGKETFTKLNSRFPSIPFIVMTHSKDRALALEMIQEGAADFVIKSYGDEEEIFRRITFAVEKHRHSVRVNPDAAKSYHKLERAQMGLQEAQDRDDSPSTIRNIQVEVTAAVAELSRRMFTELQGISLKLGEITLRQEDASQDIKTLDKELLRGHSNRPSMRSQVDLLEHRVRTLEGDVKEVESDVKEVGGTHIQLTTAKMSNKTKIILGVLTLLGIIATAIATYFAAAAGTASRDPKPVVSTPTPAKS